MERKTQAPPHLSAELVDHLWKGARVAGEVGVRLRLTVLQTDLWGFARATARLDSAVVVRLLHDYFSVMTDLAVAHRATIDKLNGNAIRLLFGLPQPREDDSARAVRTALEMQRAFLGLRNTWRRDARRRATSAGLRVGVATGEVVITSGGPTEATEYVVTGRAIECAGHLCGASRDAEVLIDVATHGAVAENLADDAVFTPIDVDMNGDSLSAFRCQLQRPRLHLVRRRN